MAPLRYANQRAEDEEEDYDSLNTANMMFEFNKIVAADLRKSNDPAARRWRETPFLRTLHFLPLNRILYLLPFTAEFHLSLPSNLPRVSDHLRLSQ